MAMTGSFLGFEHLYDARIFTEDGFEFPVHRILLAMKSEYFHDLLCSLPVEDKEILVPEIQGQTMKIVIDYIYTGKMNLTGHDIRDILVAAYFLGIEELLHSSRILAIKSLTTANSVALFLASVKIEKLGTQKACFRFIEVNFEAIVRSSGSRYGDLPVHSLEEFLASDSLNVLSENQVWNAIVVWVAKDPETRKKYVKNLIPCIRFYDAHDDLTTEILNHPFVKDNYVDIACHIELISHFSPAHKHRTPNMIFFFTKFYITRSDYTEGIKIFLTYDENIDVWRNISSNKFHPDVILHGCGPIVMMFDTMTNEVYSFDIISKNWSHLSRPNIPRREYNVVKLGSHVYVIGGLSTVGDSDEIITIAEKYDFDSETWEFSKPHYALSQGSATILNNRIYIVGTIYGFYSEFLAAQVYNPDANIWQSINPPQRYRRQFAFVAYNNRLFILGGHSSEGFLKSVEVFDDDKNCWINFQELPFPYFLPKAVIIKDLLYVFDNNSDDAIDFRCPPVFWDERSNMWQVVEASSPFCDLHLYQFCTIEDSEVIAETRQENRDPCTKWEESPFFTHLNADLTD